MLKKTSGKGWRSRWHPKVLDYRTVDELGLAVETLENERLPKTAAAKAHAEQLVDAMLIEGASADLDPATSGLSPCLLALATTALANPDVAGSSSLSAGIWSPSASSW